MSLGRRIPNRNETLTYSEITNSEPGVVLTYLLNNTHPAELHDLLLKSIQSGSGLLARDVENLLRALKTAGVVTSAAEEAARDITDRHCVRCHRNYLERNNGHKACVVPHDVPRRCTGYKDYYPCCNCFLDPGVVPSFPHFIGRHTTKPDGVAYTTTNVLSCEQKKCFVRMPGVSYVKQP